MLSPTPSLTTARSAPIPIPRNHHHYGIRRRRQSMKPQVEIK